MTGDSVRVLATRRALTTLPAGWRALHGVRSQRRHLTAIDHIVVGPSGVFVVMDQWVSLEATLGAVADAAMALAELIPLDPHLVVPVLCHDGEEAVPPWAGDVVVCTTDELADVLTTRASVLDSKLTALVFARLQEALPASISRSGSSARPKRQPIPREPRRQRSSAKPLPWTPGEEASPAVRAALVALVVCLVLCPLIGHFVWPVVWWFEACVNSLLH